MYKMRVVVDGGEVGVVSVIPYCGRRRRVSGSPKNWESADEINVAVIMNNLDTGHRYALLNNISYTKVYQGRIITLEC